MSAASKQKTRAKALVGAFANKSFPGLTEASEGHGNDNVPVRAVTIFQPSGVLLRTQLPQHVVRHDCVGKTAVRQTAHPRKLDRLPVATVCDNFGANLQRDIYGQQKPSCRIGSVANIVPSAICACGPGSPGFWMVSCSSQNRCGGVTSGRRSHRKTQSPKLAVVRSGAGAVAGGDACAAGFGAVWAATVAADRITEQKIPRVTLSNVIHASCHRRIARGALRGTVAITRPSCRTACPPRNQRRPAGVHQGLIESSLSTRQYRFDDEAPTPASFGEYLKKRRRELGLQCASTISATSGHPDQLLC